MNTGEYLTIAELGRVLKVSPTTAWRRVRDGEIKAINIGSRRRPKLRVTSAALAEYARKCEIAGAA